MRVWISGARCASLCSSVLLLVTTLLAAAAPAGAVNSFVEFESGQVRPLALSTDGSTLFAVNTPDNRLELFSVGGGTLTHTGFVQVGLEPVAVAVRNANEVWVVNHLSDSVSVIDVSTAPAHVTRTLLVGDEPRDIVFAGPGGNLAFITTAHRGQNNPNDPQLTTPGVGRADVWVFDATNLGSSLGGTPITIVTLFGDTPRALARSTDGNTVYAAVFHSGNQTVALSEGVVCNGGSGVGSCVINGVTYPGGLPAPNKNVENITGPETGLIVKYNGTHWVDRLGRNWDNAVRFNLPDRDVFAIDATANPPVQSNQFTGVGTIIFNMAVNPVNGNIYVTNTDAHNEVRFEGPGGGGSTVNGHLHEADITVISGGSVNPRHLNKHIDYSVVPSPDGVKDKSLAQPVGMAVSSDGATLYVAAFGSSKIGVFSTVELEDDTFVPDSANHIVVTGGGPTGLVLDEANSRLYALTRFDNGISVIDTGTRAEVDHLSLFNPEPASIVNGRPFLYNAYYTSSNGEAACGSCHIFGDFDSLAWDLGDPDDVVEHNPNPFRVPAVIDPDFHPLKGPMTTQSLRGLGTSGPMHWRGDRTAGNDPGGNSLDSVGAFKKFNVAFGTLLGRTGPLTDAEMQAFTDFILQVTYPPNPIRPLDNSVTPDQQAGRNFFLTSSPSDTLETCNGCHHLDPTMGFFGTDGFSSFENETQDFKIPHLRNLYQKVGMFGMPSVPFFNPGNNASQGDQVRGFGFLHDGSVDTLFRFHNATVFDSNGANPGGFSNDTQRRQVEQFMLAFDSNLAPIVGQEVTLTDTNAATVGSRIDLLLARATVTECDVVVKGTVSGEQRGWYRTLAGTFRSDRQSEPLLSDAALRKLAAVPGQELTYTAVPFGSGVRIGVDRDEDGFYDRDELDAGADPTSSSSVPHDAMVLALRPLNITVPASGASVTKSVRVSVRNANLVKASGGSDQTIKLVASLGDCPAGIVVGTPDFGRAMAATQDTAQVAAGRSKSAVVTLTLNGAAFTNFNKKSPLRCTMTFTASVVGTSDDPTASNNTAMLEINLTDPSDPQQSTTHESVIKSATAMHLTVARHKTTAVRRAAFTVVNADVIPSPEDPGHTITVTASDGDCPAGTVTGVTFAGGSNTMLVKGGRTAAGHVQVNVDTASGFSGATRISPARCTALLTATGPAGNTEPDPSNNTTRLVIDVTNMN